MQATELIAGRALDALVAEKVMQLRVSQSTATHLVSGYDDPEGWGDSDSVWEPVPLYSTDIAAAWQVVEHMQAKWGPLMLIGGYINNEWSACFGHQLASGAETPALAICRTALALVDH